MNSSVGLAFALAVPAAALGEAAPDPGPDPGRGSVLLCELLHAKAMPSGFAVDAVAFTGPAGDGRRGSAGFLVNARDLLNGPGTRLSFSFQRAPSGYGFQVIHPHGDGHVLVAVHPSVRIYGGGSWSQIGWGDPSGSEKVKLKRDADKLLQLQPGKNHEVTSELSADGRYRLVIDDIVVCQHRVRRARALVLETAQKPGRGRRGEDQDGGTGIYGGSGWDRTGFAGDRFRPRLEPGQAGLILGPMDGSAPTQNFRHVRLGAVR